MKNLIITRKRVAQGLMTDGSYEALCPPLQALLRIMVDGNFEGKDRMHPEIRKLFSRDYVLDSDWYRNRLLVKQQRDIAFRTSKISYLENVLTLKNYEETAQTLNLPTRLQQAREQLAHVRSAAYLDELFGTLGADPLK
jgi:hypothetical protein